MGSILLILGIYVLALARVTRIVTRDTILDGARLTLIRLLGPGNPLVYFLSCPWCAGLWLALGTAWIPATLLLGWPWWAFLPLGLAANYVVAMLDQLDQAENITVEPLTPPTSED